MGIHMGLRERRHRQTSADIRDAAVRLARERGFDKVTIDEICTQAGISPRTFLNYFPNKESAIAVRMLADNARAAGASEAEITEAVEVGYLYGGTAALLMGVNAFS